jgi:polyhydroxyalkanoate synthesis regulator phasin
MSIELHQGQLTAISTSDPVLVEAAETAFNYTEMCKRGEISKEEYIELIADIQRQANINQSMNDLETLEKLNTAINGLITLAKMA